MANLINGCGLVRKCFLIGRASAADGTRAMRSCTVFRCGRTLMLRQSRWPHSGCIISIRSCATP